MKLDRNLMHVRAGWCVVEDGDTVVWAGGPRSQARRVARGRPRWRVALMLVITCVQKPKEGRKS